MQKESQVIYLVLFTVIGYCWMAWKCITIKSIENIKNRNKDQPIYGNYSLEWKDLRGGNTEQLRKTKPPKQNRMIPRFNLINPQPFTKTKYPWRYDFSKASKENFSQHTWKISIIKDLKMHNCYLVWSQVTNSRTWFTCTDTAGLEPNESIWQFTSQSVHSKANMSFAICLKIVAEILTTYRGTLDSFPFRYKQ